MIAFSLDIDWAPDEVIEYTLSLFESYNIKCTVFSTHRSGVVNSANRELFEIGIHPNFNPLLSGKHNRSAGEIIDDILEIHPGAKGVRSHTLMQSTLLLQMMEDREFLYDSNHFLPYHTGLKPFLLWNGLIRIPYNWEDDVHWYYGNTFNDLKMDLKAEGLLLFNFHPMHIFINTENQLRYDEAKKCYQQPKSLEKIRNTETKGACNALISLLEYCKENKINTKTLLEIAMDCLNNSHANRQ